MGTFLSGQKHLSEITKGGWVFFLLLINQSWKSGYGALNLNEFLGT